MSQGKARASSTSGSKKSQLTETSPAAPEPRISEPSAPSASSSSTSSSTSSTSSASRKNVDVDSMIERYKIRLPRDYEKSSTSTPQMAHFAEELEEEIPETIDELRAGKKKDNTK
jgi:hypothetical protein